MPSWRIVKRLMLAAVVSALCLVPLVAQAGITPGRGLWVGHVQPVLDSPAEQKALLNAIAEAGITDLYLRISAETYTTDEAQLAKFNALMTKHKVAVWGLDGCRCYFADAGGRKGLYASVDAMIAYNDRVAPEARFAGFQNISLPHDLKGYRPSFHNERTNSQLASEGKGVWQETKALDREYMLRDWADMQKSLSARLKPKGLKMAAAVLSSTENYYGEPMSVTYDGRTGSVGHIMMAYVDDFIVLTFNTDPANAAGRMSAQAAYASALPEAVRPRVFGVVETEAGNGPTISYGDTPEKRSQAVVLQDLATMEALLKGYGAFAGVGIHSWEGWKALDR